MAVDRLRPANPAVLSMTGTWRFKLDHGASPAVNGELPADAAIPDFATPAAFNPSEAGWTNIHVPANWGVAGFSQLTHGRADNNGVTLFLSSAIASTGWGVVGDDIRLTQTNALTGGFRLRLASNAK
jgi:hypothetical protein